MTSIKGKKNKFEDSLKIVLLQLENININKTKIKALVPKFAKSIVIPLVKAFISYELIVKT